MDEEHDWRPTPASNLGLFVRFVRENPNIQPEDPVIMRALIAYMMDSGLVIGEGHQLT